MTFDVYKILIYDGTVIEQFSTRGEAIAWLNSPHNNVTAEMYVVDVKGNVMYSQPNYGAKTLQREGTKDNGGTRTSEEQRRNTDSALRKKILQDPISGRPRW